ncbi:hypothetical protein EVA_10179 [gut metagenome]|uniref:Uncharacterized protein n=1 Tax=gut metagenome TaxID=749906 RepID=J9G3C9_9ZZZZ
MFQSLCQFYFHIWCNSCSMNTSSLWRKIFCCGGFHCTSIRKWKNALNNSFSKGGGAYNCSHLIILNGSGKNF